MSNHDRADLLIVTPPPCGVDIPPLAAACLSSNLTYHGIAVDVFDLNVRLYKRVPDHCHHLWGMEVSYQWRQEESCRAIRARLAPYLESLLGEIISHPAKGVQLQKRPLAFLTSFDVVGLAGVVVVVFHLYILVSDGCFHENEMFSVS